MAHGFRLVRERSLANSKYEFNFIGNSHRAVVPVLQRYDAGYRLIGTGSYFIKPNIFITAAHLFEGEDIKPNDSFFIISEGSSNDPLKIIAIHKHESWDLAFMVLEQPGEKYFEGTDPIAVMNLAPEKDEIVAVFGYSHSTVDPNNVTEVNGDVVQIMQLRCKWELGAVLEIHDNGHRFLKGQCFETNILAEGRDSGAPMFNSSGFLVGLLSTSFAFEEGMPNSLCSSILDLADIPIGGMPIRELWNKTTRAAHCKMRRTFFP